MANGDHCVTLVAVLFCRENPPTGGFHQRKALIVAKATDVRPKITMACVECKERNYITKKNRRNNPDRLELKKYCPRCKTSQVHKETR